MRVALAIVLLWAATAYANPFLMLCSQGSGPAAQSCDGTASYESTVQDNVYSLGNTTSNYYLGRVIQANSADICSEVRSLKAVAGDITDKIFTVEIWSMDGNDLDTLLYSSQPVTPSTNPTDHTDYTFEFPDEPTVSSGAVVITMNETDNSNYANITLDQSNNDSGRSHYGRWNSSGVSQYYNTGFDVYYSEYPPSP